MQSWGAQSQPATTQLLHLQRRDHCTRGGTHSSSWFMIKMGSEEQCGRVAYCPSKGLSWNSMRRKEKPSLGVPSPVQCSILATQWSVSITTSLKIGNREGHLERCFLQVKKIAVMFLVPLYLRHSSPARHSPTRVKWMEDEKVLPYTAQRNHVASFWNQTKGLTSGKNFPSVSLIRLIRTIYLALHTLN